MKKIILLFFCLFNLSLYSQQWNSLGPNDFNQASITPSIGVTKMSFDNSGNVYTGYQRNTVSGFQLRRFNQNQWELFSTINANVLDYVLLFDTNNIAYLAYSVEGTNGIGQSLIVKKLNNNIWQDLSSLTVNCGSFDFSIDNNNIPYIIYNDNNNNGIAIVLKFVNNSWQSLGAVSTNSAENCKIKIGNNNVPYIGYSQYASSTYTTTLKKYENNSWQELNTSSLNSQFNGQFNSLNLDNNNNPYVLENSYLGNTVKKFQNGSWITMGSALGSSDYSSSFDIDANANVYVLYNDNSGNIIAKKFDGTNWSIVGSSLLSSQPSKQIKLLNNVPYISFTDDTNFGKNTLRKFNGNNWNVIGDVAISTSSGEYSKTQIIKDSNNIPYLLLDDVNVGSGYKACKVFKLSNNTWQSIGVFDSCYYGDMAFDSNNMLYVCYLDYNDGLGKVKKFNGLLWENLGNFSSGNIVNAYFGGGPDIAIDNNNVPYVSYETFTNPNINVKKYNGTNWVSVGASNFVLGQNSKIAIDSIGTPYIAYSNGTNNKISVQKFNGVSWQLVGTSGFSTGQAQQISMSIDNNNVVYVVYQDIANSFKPAVQRFQNNAWQYVGASSMIGTLTTYSYISIAFDNLNNPYIGFSNNSNGKKATVLKFNGLLWETVNNTAFSAFETKGVSLVVGSDNIPTFSYDSYGVFVKYSGPSDYYGTQSPTAASQSFCNSATVANLVATGQNLKWYNVANSGTALTTNTTLTTGTYYVSQTVNSVESTRTSVAVTINTTSAPTASPQTFNSNATVSDLVATGTNLKWYDVTTGGSSLNTSTPLISGTYYVSQTIDGCESSRTTVLVTITLLYTDIPDENFEQALFDQGVDTINGDHRVLTSAISGLTGLSVDGSNIMDLSGIEGFINLQYLSCANNQLTNLNVSGLTNLRNLDCFDNQLMELNVSGLINLQSLSCPNNQLSDLDMSGLTSLQYLNCGYNSLSNLSVSGLNNLLDLACVFNNLTELDLNGLTSLQHLECIGNQLTNINVSGLVSLRELYCANNQLTDLNVSGLTSLQYVDCGGNQLTNLNLSGLTSLQYLDCSNNQLSNINLIGLSSLQTLNCSVNLLTDLNVSGLTNLQFLYCSINQLTTINVSGLTSLINLGCDQNQLTNLSVSGLTSLQSLDCKTNQLTNLNVTGLTSLQELSCLENQLSSLDLKGIGNLNYFNSRSNTALSCISVDDVAFATNNYLKDATTSFSTNCNLSIVNYCKGDIASQLTTTAAPGSTLKWYTVATGGTGSLIAPTPSTSSVGVKNYYVSQVVSGIESSRATITVNTYALPSTPGIISGTVAQGALVGTNTTATYSIAAVAGATSYLWTPPTGVNIVGGQGTTSITVNFNDVSSGAGAIGNLYVQSVNASGCISLVRKLALTKALPAAPTSLVMTDGITTKSITSFAKYMGTAIVLKLTAAMVTTATSYEWELPEGVTRTDGLGLNSTVPYIFVNFSGVTNTNTFNYTTTAGVSTNVLRIGVKAKNGVGVSVSNNAALVNPTTTSTAKQLILNAVRPAIVSTVTGQIAGLCGGSVYAYTITDTTLASSYIVNAPAGAVVTFTSPLTFTVTYPFGFVINTSTSVANKTLAITSVNGIGTSLTTKNLTLSTTMPALASIAGGTTYSSCDQTFITPLVTSAITYTWTVPIGASIVSGQNTNTVVVNYGSLTGTQTIKVKTTNACGVSSAIKSVALTAGSCPMILKSEPVVNLVNNIKLYPNPVSSVLSFETTNNSKIDNIVIVDFLGKVIFEGKPENNQINVERLASGTYILQAFSGEEKFNSKFVKE